MKNAGKAQDREKGMGLTTVSAAAEFAHHKAILRMLPDDAATFAQ